MEEGRRSHSLEFMKQEHGDSASQKPRERLLSKERQSIGEALMPKESAYH